MRYTVNYEGAFFTDDTDGFNCFETDSWAEARNLLTALLANGFKTAYIKDEEYECTFRWDERDKEFVWD